jgi:WD40 repeat protein
MCFTGIVAFGSSCIIQTEMYNMKETLLTSGAYGHTLNFAQVFSPDDQWIVYDTRNDDTHIQYTGSIEKVNVETGEVVKIYSVVNQTQYGPGVGAVAYHPFEDKVIFIHGLMNCNAEHPYGFARRFGAIVTMNNDSLFHAEGRTIREPLVAGALRGGTHAHTWSEDGEWISFTYNDYLMETLEKSTDGLAKDLRTIGVMTSTQSVRIWPEDEENFSGKYFAVVAASVTENPVRGSDEIERAFDECWIGEEGYIKADGKRQHHAIAFQGNVRDADGHIVTEVFVADIPEDITKARVDEPLEGTYKTRQNVPQGLVQRRITFTAGRKHPGLQGPRFRLRTSPDGSEIYFLMKDDADVVQVFSVPTRGGAVHQITHLDYAVQAQFNVSPDGNRLSVVADNSIWLIEIESGQTIRVTERTDDNSVVIGGVLWSHNGKMIVFNRYEKVVDKRYLQIVKIDME